MTGRKSIKELFKDFNGKYEPIEIDWDCTDLKNKQQGVNYPMATTYDDFHNNLSSSIQNKYFKILAVYGPDESDMQGCYMAAVDLFNPGNTYKMFFSMDDNHKITIHHIERWYAG